MSETHQATAWPRAAARTLYQLIALGVALCPFSVGLAAAADSTAMIRDGKLFDPGLGRAAPAETAPAGLSRFATWIGDWDLIHEMHRPTGVVSAKGRARITYMNRGHALMERSRIPDFDGAGHDLATLAFIGVDPQGVWTVSEGNSWTESITLWSGGWSGDDLTSASLVLHDALRPGGGPLLLLLRRSYIAQGPDQFEVHIDTSADLGISWQPNSRRFYSRHLPDSDPSADFFPVRDDVGLPAPERGDEAAQFDFLVGEFDAQHWQQPPTGPARRWRSSATAVYVLDGKAILEFNSFDLDPSLPDAATSILRLYNTSMRRWESLFLPNRTHRPLYFGGVREGDQIVLHLFKAQTSAGSVFQWVFFDLGADSYRWKGLGSPDRGQTYSLNWGIDFVRKGTAQSSAEVREVEARAGDGTKLFADHYRAAAPAATTVVLFHQAGGDARGEYAAIARRLQADGFEVFAWDVRGGGDRFGSQNRTVSRLAEPFDGSYCDAYPDLEAALRYSVDHASGASLYVVGSSYSAALAVRLAAEHGRLLAGAIAFSPASSRMDHCAVERWLGETGDTLLLVFRPASELEHEAAVAQRDLLEAGGVEVFVGPGVHGASMLDAKRSGEVETTWQRLRAFFADPAAPAPAMTP